MSKTNSAVRSCISNRGPVKNFDLETEMFLSSLEEVISVQDRNFRIVYQTQLHKDMIGDRRGEYCYKA